MEPLKHLADALANLTLSPFRMVQWMGRTVSRIFESEYDHLQAELIKKKEQTEKQITDLGQTISASELDSLKANLVSLRAISNSVPSEDRLTNSEVRELTLGIDDLIKKHEFLDAAVPLARESPETKKAILEFLSRLDPENRLAVLRNIALILTQEGFRFRDCESLVQIAHDNTQEDLNQALLLLHGKDFTEHALEKVLEFISLVPDEVRARVVAQSIPFVSHAQNTNEIGHTVTILSWFAKSNKLDYIEAVAPLIDQVANLELQNVLRIAAMSTKEEFVHLRDGLSLFFDRFPLSDSRNTFLFLLTKTVPDERAALLNNLFEATDGIEYDHSLIHFLDALDVVHQTLGPGRTFELLYIVVKDPIFKELQASQRETAFVLTARAMAEAQENQDKCAYVIECSSKKYLDDPKRTLEVITRDFNEQAGSSLMVKFSDAPSIDLGGPARQVISTLFEKLVTTLPFTQGENGLYRPRLQGDMKSLDAFYQMGQLMLFCLNSREDNPYPIGMLFDLSLFAGLTKVKNIHTQKPFEEMIRTDDGFRALLSLYEDMNRYNQEDKKKIDNIKKALSPLTQETPEKVLHAAYALAELDSEIEALGIDYDSDKIRENYEKIQDAIKRVVIKEILAPELLPLLAMVQGMNDCVFQKVTWHDIHRMSPIELSKKLQGTVERSTVIQNLTFDEGIPDEKAKWLLEWIEEADEKMIQRFLFALTGAPALGRVKLKISPINEDVDYTTSFHTCFNTLDFAFNRVHSKQELVKELEDAIKDDRFSAI